MEENMEITITVERGILLMREEFVVRQLQELVVNAFRDMQDEYLKKVGCPTASVHLDLTVEAYIPPEILRP